MTAQNRAGRLIAHAQTLAKPESIEKRRLFPEGPGNFPKVYGLIIEGNCMHPLLADRDTGVFSRTEPFLTGDLVAIYLRPDLIRPRGHQAMVKRLVSDLPNSFIIGGPAKAGDGVPIMLCEQLNPSKVLSIRADHIIAIHKYIGRLPCENIGLRGKQKDPRGRRTS